MRARALWSLAGVWTVWSAVAAGTSIQTPIKFRSSSDTVEVHATVKLRNGTIARDLVKENFELYEDGKLREITVFSKSIQPLSVALVLDHSGSTDMQFDDVLAAAREFIGHLIRGDRAAVFTLTWDCHEFTDKHSSLLNVLRSPIPIDFGSPIWAGTDRAMSALETEGGRRIILLMTDGQDTQRGLSGIPFVGAPPHELRALSPCEYAPVTEVRTAKDVIARAVSDAIMVYTVSVEAPGVPKSEDLADISNKTGALPQRLKDYDDLKGAFRSVADELHLQYVLGFTPSFTDGMTHKIEVKVKRSGVNVHARKAYVAAKK